MFIFDSRVFRRTMRESLLSVRWLLIWRTQHALPASCSTRLSQHNNMGRNRYKSTKVSEIWEKMGSTMPNEKVMGPNRHKPENYEDLQPMAQSMKPTLWTPSDNLSFGLLPNVKLTRSYAS